MGLCPFVFSSSIESIYYRLSYFYFSTLIKTFCFRLFLTSPSPFRECHNSHQRMPSTQPQCTIWAVLLSLRASGVVRFASGVLGPGWSEGNCLGLWIHAPSGIHSHKVARHDRGPGLPMSRNLESCGKRVSIPSHEFYCFKHSKIAAHIPDQTSSQHNTTHHHSR